MHNDVHLSGEGHPTPVSVPHSPTVADLVAAAKQAGIIPPEVRVEEIVLFVIDEEEPMSADRLHASPNDRLRIHWHRCRKIEVTVVYNLKKHTKAFAPGITVRHVLKWALHEFGLKGADAENKELRLGEASNEVMKEDAAIGCYARHPKCELTAYLADIVQPQG